MEEQLINVGSVLGKDILNLEDGAFVGSVQGVVISAAEQKITGVQLKQKGLLGSKNVLPFENIKAFGSHAITINSLEGIMAAEGRGILGMAMVTVNGTILGKVLDFAFDSSGTIVEYVLKGGMMKGLPEDRGVIAAGEIIAIGKDVIIAREDADKQSFQIEDKEIYGDWQTVDEILEDIDDDKEDDDHDYDEHYEEQFDELTNKINKTINDVTNRIKEINTEELADKFKEQADKFSGEAKNLFGSFMDKMSLKNPKCTKKEEEDALVQQIIEQLKGATVERPLLDDEGNVIVWPGQIIGIEEVKATIKAGKLQELINMTTQLVEENKEQEEIIISAEKEGNPEESGENNTQA